MRSEDCPGLPPYLGCSLAHTLWMQPVHSLETRGLQTSWAGLWQLDCCSGGGGSLPLEDCHPGSCDLPPPAMQLSHQQLSHHCVCVRILR